MKKHLGRGVATAAIAVATYAALLLGDARAEATFAPAPPAMLEEGMANFAAGLVELRFAPFKLVQQVCRTHFGPPAPGDDYWACTFSDTVMSDGTRLWLILMWDIMPQSGEFLPMFDHELAHTAGWNAEHTNGR